MTQTAIPIEFENYLQTKVSAGEAPDMNQIVFAYIPDLDLESEIDREDGLVDEAFWVYQQDVDQVGKLNDNALVYSVVVPSTIQAFTFNAIYLHDKNTENSCGMVIHKAEETKEAGMVTTRSLVQQYNGAAYLTNITVTAETWQIDYQARMLGIDEEQRLSSLVAYGHTAFVEGFDISQNADPTKFTIASGVAYIGGLRAELTEENIQTVSSEIDIYLDVSRSGTANSKWENEVTIAQSSSTLSDYTDGSGVNHYVAKLASIDADGVITNFADEQTGRFELAGNAATNDDIENFSNDDKHIKLEQYWAGIDKKLSGYVKEDDIDIDIAQSNYDYLHGDDGFQRETVSANGITKEIWFSVERSVEPNSSWGASVQLEGAINAHIQITPGSEHTMAYAHKYSELVSFFLNNEDEVSARTLVAHIYICAQYDLA